MIVSIFKKKINLPPSLVLVFLCCVLSVVLSLLNLITKPIIDERKREEELSAYREITQGYEIVGEKKEIKDNSNVKSYYIIKSKDGNGFLLNLVGSGYGGEFKMAASFDIKGNLIASKMLDNSETPGLGKKSEEKWYMLLFTKTKTIPKTKNDLSSEDKALVSGASVTFQSVASVLNNAQQWVIKEGKNERNN